MGNPLHAGIFNEMAVPLGKALPIAREIVERLRQAFPDGRFALAGGVRRGKETVSGIAILASGETPEAIRKAFAGLPGVRDGIRVDLRVVAEESFGAALHHFTGSRQHNVRLREMASRKGLKIDEHGVFRQADCARLGGREEEDIYEALGLPFIPPEMREDVGEIEAASEGRLPDLISLSDIRGDLHVHTKRSDGAHGLGEIIEAARRHDYEYVAITDHSKVLAIAHGLTEERVREQMGEIDAANRKLERFRVLKGIEVDILDDGTLDFPDALLAELDIVVASIHTGFLQSGEQITRRLIAAIRNPYVSIIAHPTGRLLGEREAYAVDLEAVLAEAARYGKALEINANPQRLDLSDRWARAAKRLGIPIAISTDTHALKRFEMMEYGVSVARRGWLEAGDVLNTLPLRDLRERLASMRGQILRGPGSAEGRKQ